MNISNILKFIQDASEPESNMKTIIFIGVGLIIGMKLLKVIFRGFRG